MRRHLETVKSRLLGSDSGLCLLTSMLSLFENVEEPLRKDHLLHWSPTGVSLVTAEEEKPGEEYVCYDLLRFLSDSGKRKRVTREEESTLKRSRTKEKRKILLLPWEGYTGYTPSIYTDAFTERCALLREHFSQGGTYYAPCRHLDPEHHKLTFTLTGPIKLKLCNVRGGSVQVPASRHSPHHLLVSNCVVKLGERTDLTLYRKGGEHVEIPSSTTHLDLREVVGLNEVCYITTGSALELCFSERRPGLLLLRTETHCKLDLGACFLEYWTEVESATRPPFRYIVEDASYLERLCRMSSSVDEGGPLVLGDLPERYRDRMPGFYDSIQRYHLVKRMKVYFVKEVPHFFIDDELQMVTLVEGVYTVIHGGSTLATFTLDRVERVIRFRLIYSEHSIVANPLHFHIY